MRSIANTNDAAASPLVSIILSCYNSEKYLAETLASVRIQSYQNWELIAVNDCSTDTTQDILRCAASTDPRIKHIERKTRGGKPSITKNTGLDHAKGQYIAFLDHDDLYLPAKIEELVTALELNKNCVAAFHDLEYIDAQSQASGQRYLPNFIKEADEFLTPIGNDTYICSERFFVFQTLRYSAMQTTGCLIAKERLPPGSIVFNTDYTIVDDKDLWIRLSLLGNLLYRDCVLARYRVHEGNLSKNGLQLHIDLANFFENNILRVQKRLTSTESAAMKQQLATVFSQLGWAMRVANRHQEARAAYVKSIKIKPSLAALLAYCKAGMQPRV